jgi:hypothetical protein
MQYMVLGKKGLSECELCLIQVLLDDHERYIACF